MNIDSYHYKTNIPIRFGDLNAFGVVNNDVFLTYFEMAHSGYWRQIVNWKSVSKGIIIQNAEINYKKPVRFNDELFAYVKISNLRNCSFEVDYILTILHAGEEDVCTTGKTVCVFFNYNTNKPERIPAIERQKMIDFEALVY
ncbi:Thioesterase superfamily [Arcticibacter svalbardensis MN12-7]|uniref:Thioesterase superfamily n=1 Tax=Arcticibacter svalbardensis MN12-7 TaxID=1150600 RepID=R9GPS2_9SPHI|nr:thioesterase family protein [Arcticibacter svalbardensis]EOR93688.1 Thioesterase superfamily [Arcticibacter svalbardensis MN12-7]